MSFLVIYLAIGTWFVVMAIDANERQKFINQFGGKEELVPPLGIIFIGLTWPFSLWLWILRSRGL